MNEPDKELGIIADFIQEKELFFPARDQVTSKDYKYVYQGVKKSTATEYNKFLKPDLCQFILDETAESAYFFNNENTKKYYNKNLKGPPMRLEPLSRNQFKDRNREFSQNILEYAIGRVK